MADWTNLPNQAVGVGGLPSGTTVTALRDNPIAIAQGAAGAPRLRGFAAMTVAEYLSLFPLSVDVGVNTLNAEAYDGQFTNISNATSTFQSAGIIEAVFFSGNARFRATQFATGGSLSTSQCEIRLLKNGTVVNTFVVTAGTEAGGTVSATRGIDISVAVGDTFEWQQRRSSGTNTGVGISNMSILVDDTVILIGLPIKRSEQ